MKRIPLDSKRSQGLTLLELLVAMTILSIGLLGLLAVQTQALQGSRHGRHVSEAARVGEQQMEFLQRQPWAAIPVSAWSAPRVVTGPSNGLGPAQGQQYTVIWRVQAGPDPALRMLDVQINWRTPDTPVNSPGSVYAISSVRHNDP